MTRDCCRLVYLCVLRTEFRAESILPRRKVLFAQKQNVSWHRKTQPGAKPRTVGETPGGSLKECGVGVNRNIDQVLPN